MSLAQLLVNGQKMLDNMLLEEKNEEIVRLKAKHQALLETHQELQFLVSDYETRNKKLEKENEDLKLQTNVLRESNSFNFDERAQKAEVMSLRDELKTLQLKYTAKCGLDEEVRNFKIINSELEERLVAKTKLCSSYEKELYENAKQLSVKREYEKGVNCSVSNDSFNLKCDIQSMTKEIEDCRATIHLREEGIVKVENDLKVMKQTVECGVQDLHAKEELIVQLETELQALKQTIQYSDQTLHVKEERITQLEKDLRVIDEKLQNSRKTLNLKGELIVQLEKQLGEEHKQIQNLKQENEKLIKDNRKLETAQNEQLKSEIKVLSEKLNKLTQQAEQDASKVKVKLVRESTFSKLPRRNLVNKEPVTPSPGLQSIATDPKKDQSTRQSRLGRWSPCMGINAPSPVRLNIAMVDKQQEAIEKSRVAGLAAHKKEVTSPSPVRLNIPTYPKQEEATKGTRLGRRPAHTAAAAAIAKDRCAESEIIDEMIKKRPKLAAGVSARNKKTALDSTITVGSRRVKTENVRVKSENVRVKSENVTGVHAQGNSEPHKEAIVAEGKKGKQRKTRVVCTVVSEEQSQPSPPKRCLRKRL